MTPLSFSRGQMVREASLTEADLAEVAKCRRDHNRLGFAYQIGFVRLFSRFPAQQPLEICDELLSFVAMQLNIDATGIDGYAARQHTVSDHQARIRDYLKLVVFDPEQAEALERFVFEESCRLEQTASLLARAREFLKERRVLFPAESVAAAAGRGAEEAGPRTHRFQAGRGPYRLAWSKALDGLLEVKEGEAISGLQAIKANPAKPSAAAMQGLADKLTAIEATGVLAVDLSWLNANYQRALFHYVRKCSADRLREVARPRRLAALVCFLRQSYRDAVDQAVDMFDKLLTRTHTRAEHELNDQMRSQRQTIKAALAALRSLGAIILDDSVGDAALASAAVRRRAPRRPGGPGGGAGRVGHRQEERRVPRPRPAVQPPAAVLAGPAPRPGVLPGRRRRRGPLPGGPSGPQGDERRPEAETPRGRPHGLHPEAALALGRDRRQAGPEGVGVRLAAEAPGRPPVGQPLGQARQAVRPVRGLLPPEGALGAAPEVLLPTVRPARRPQGRPRPSDEAAEHGLRPLPQDGARQHLRHGGGGRLAPVHGRRRDVGRRGANAAGRPEEMAGQADADDPAPGPAHRGR